MKQKYIEYSEEELKSLRSKDKKLAKVIDKIGYISREKESDIFSSVVHKIIGQQISIVAQKTIWKRFNENLGTVTPETILSISTEEIKHLGLSYRKAEYIQDFALKVKEKSFDIEALPNLDDEALKTELVKLKGIGIWTAEMLMIFCLGRKNILSYDDLGIRRGLQILYGHKKIDKELFKKYAKRFSPYGTIASFYLWEISNEAVKMAKTDKKQNNLNNKARKTKVKNKVKSEKSSYLDVPQNYGIYNTKLGKVKIVEEAGNIVSIAIVGEIESETNFDKFNSEAKTQNSKMKNYTTPILDETYKQLCEYLDGKRKNFDFEFSLKGTEFQKKVWEALLEIPYGQTKTYKEIAIKIGNPKASRAVGMANNKNPIMIVVPCHRVIGSDGKLTGYAAGIDIKKRLLNLEQKN